jgi:hypothetical protein
MKRDYKLAEAIHAKITEWTAQGVRFHPTDIFQLIQDVSVPDQITRTLRVELDEMESSRDTAILAHLRARQEVAALRTQLYVLLRAYDEVFLDCDIRPSVEENMRIKHIAILAKTMELIAQ